MQRADTLPAKEVLCRAATTNQKGKMMNKAQFKKRCMVYGFKPSFMGYYEIGHGLAVYPRNAGDDYRAQLKYMLDSLEEYEQELKDKSAKNKANGIRPRS